MSGVFVLARAMRTAEPDVQRLFWFIACWLGAQVLLIGASVSSFRSFHRQRQAERQLQHVAQLQQSILDSAGIECFLGDENTVRMDWLWSNLLGGVKLWVRQGDFAAATELLKQDFSDGFEMGGAGEYKPPKCPYCKSPDISFEELNRAVAHPGLMLGIPIPMNRVGWLCHACGKTWSDDENHSAPSAS